MPVQLISEYPAIDPVTEASCFRTGEYLLAACDRQNHQFTILLTGDEAIRELNRTYRQIDRPTNVLSFPFEIDQQPFRELIGSMELGDIVISCDRAVAESHEYECTLQQRLDRLIVHGFLHLLGYDHERSERDAQIMFRREDDLVAGLSAS